MQVNPIEIFQDTVVVIAPHMDDGVLACGGSIAQLPQKDKIHVVYATDGMKSPAPVIPWRDSSSPDLGAIRMREAIAAMGFLGIPPENIHFLGLPEGRLRRHSEPLRSSLEELILQIRPANILLPFRYDRHPDHLAINHIVTAFHRQGLIQAQLVEYFVYYRWRLLPTRDVRKHIHPEYLIEVDIEEVRSQKREALDHFKSQTTKFYPWQTRPILTPILLDDVCQNPELYLCYEPSVPGASVFSDSAAWIRIAHRLEPFLQRWKYRVMTVWQKGWR